MASVKRVTAQTKQRKIFVGQQNMTAFMPARSLRKAISFPRQLCRAMDFRTWLLILEAVPAKKFPLGGRTLLGEGISNRKNLPREKKA
jgi:hypothetical protein